MKNNRLKEAREAKGYTQTKLAELVGAQGKSSVSNWENGHSKPTLETAFKLAYILNKDVDFLFGYKVQDSQTDETEQGVI